MVEREDGTAIPKVELRRRALEFSKRWEGKHSEKSEAQRFWMDFFSIFGLNERDLGTFEALAKRLSTGGDGYIDYLSPGELAVEHKSSGEDLGAAMKQLFDYLTSLSSEVKPRLLVACDFGHFYWYDIVTQDEGRFDLEDLSQNLDVFWWLAGHRRADDPVADETELNLKATELMAKVHDAVLATGYDPHHLREWLTRILFCLFADDSEVWDRRGFENYLHLYSSPDGTDLGPRLALLFQVLNTPTEARPAGLDDDLAAFTYINGDLFSDTPPLPMPICNAEIRTNLLAACRFDWSGISPAIFGSMFQNVMTASERRELGAHYTTEENILRTIKPLFLDDLVEELDAARSLPALQRLHDKLASLRFLDPACGCGNFLVVAYRELRQIETEILRRIAEKQGSTGQGAMDIALLCKVTVGQFYGIELEEFPARIARTALYLMDHQENRKVSHEFGRYFARFPIPTSPHITMGNALRLDWNYQLAADECSFIMGNPPFIGSRMASPEQKEDQEEVWAGNKLQGKLDYVTNWYKMAAEYMGDRPIKTAFVSTNSISQGEQPAVLWSELWSHGMGIDFAYGTFAWTSEAKGKAAVHVVIVGFSSMPKPRTRPLWTFATPKSDPVLTEAKNISPYLADGPDVVVTSQQQPLVSGIPPMFFGSMPRDEGWLSNISPEEAADIRQSDPIAAAYLRELIGADELIKGGERWCLWLLGASPSDITSSPVLQQRLGEVRRFRQASKAATTRAAANTPGLFVQLAQPSTRYLAVPGVSSEARRCVPMAFYEADVIASNALLTIPGATDELFGYLNSSMFMAWNRTISGRLESRIRISQEITYNNFPFPQLADAARKKVSDAAIAVLEARAAHPESSLADLYNPVAMPPNLVKAHDELDAMVESVFAPRRKFATDADRLAVLLENYQKLASPLLASAPARKRTTAKKRP